MNVTERQSLATVDNAALLGGRLLLAAIFLSAGLQKIGGYAGTADYMAAMGVPAALLPLVIALEVGGALALIAGVFTRLAALGLAGFSVAAGLLFHFDPSDQMQTIMLMKNIAIAGGLLYVAVFGAGDWALGRRLLPAGRAAASH